MYGGTNMNEIEINYNMFENIKHTDEYGCEYWYARELQTILDYTEWRKFSAVIEKSIVAYSNSDTNVYDHFVGVDKMVEIGSKASRKISNFKLSRYVCYLIVHNGDSRKRVIALAQTYFAIQTRKQEIIEKEYNSLTEDEKRIYQRNLTRKGNYSLNQTAKNYVLKILINFIIMVISDYIMVKQQMILKSEKD